MHYILRNRKVTMWVVTVDGVVLYAPESMRWSVGKRISTVMEWAISKQLRVYVSENEASQNLARVTP